ncbi:glycosyl hydrolase family 30 [Subsaximicrobium wynnwilliamsii]|uniref:Glycosyl hydrolase family 30 n=2 Tax=Subsaximicrobium wynnwilliamsii TaxID=291179 RepID=A0A5C6ZEW0_9FLAO|nr:glycosyl hydrolase family 30 [Subsaximicrobium wynnwilliamsii]TXD87683.1 glycosyl hydrolase family 30 [Subsaximicrobium wynnwilliamsii]TXE01429.1 glycosyl hydrolase family 30 [Subsaximicrobium wynnwilliamsii]
MKFEVYETSESGKKLEKVTHFSSEGDAVSIKLNPKQKFQTITGFGGSFTEASAYLLNQLSEAKRNEVLEAYFGNDGAKYSLTRTHMNSCDFSLSNYSYAPIEGDVNLEHFSVEEDREDLIPMIKDAMAISEDGFKILTSPWTAPPWMKDNNSYVGGKLLPKYYDTWALFFSKYLEAYKAEGIDVWGFTVENEPLGNSNNWESMHFTAEEMTDFVQNHLGPKLEEDGHDAKILGYDQNRGEELNHWVDVMYANEASSKHYDGTAVHWYASTYDVFPESLEYAHNKAPNKYLIQSEGCVDSEVPKWKDDQWYWSKEATDWGWDWATAENKHLHPKYAPVNRYARDIIGCLNNWVDGWIDWNMVLNKQGGPNWFENWCVAPVIVDPQTDEVYYTPLFYTMSHFSRFIRPGAVRIGIENSDDELMATAVKNPDGSYVVVAFNETDTPKQIELTLEDQTIGLQISQRAIQTIVIPNK